MGLQRNDFEYMEDHYLQVFIIICKQSKLIAKTKLHEVFEVITCI